MNFDSKEFVAYFLNIAAQAEDSDDGMFASIADAVPVELREDIMRHAADEARHARMLRECVNRSGGVSHEVPPELRFFDLLLEAAGITEPSKHLMEFFLLLETAEQRAMSQYSFISSALASMDPGTAQVLEQIAKDEASHVVHCHKLATLFAPDDATMEDAMGALREIESSVFKTFASAVMRGAPCQP